MKLPKKKGQYGMKSKGLQDQRHYEKLINSIGEILQSARERAYQQVNSILVRTYWEIGQHIVVYEQKNNVRAEYGSKLLDQIAHDLKDKFGKGFSRSNVIYMRLLYKKYPKSQTLSDQLSWSHYVELLGVDDNLSRSFYEKECLANRWSVRELGRQINSMLFERLALGNDKKKILKLAKSGHAVKEAEDIIKNPYVLEFLGLSEDHRYSEKEFEQRIIGNMQKFLL